MSEVAGRMAIQVGAASLEKEHGGKGILLGGVPGVRRGRVAILGGGVVGTNAAKIAVGMGADVTILDVNQNQLAYLDDVFLGRVEVLSSDSETIARAVREADLVVGGVLIPGGKAPKLVREDLIREMSPGSVVVDVAVDQGGCIETCRPTTHDNPTYVVHGVVHYCVANMPGAVPQTSHLRPHQRHPALRPPDRRPRAGRGGPAGQGARPRTEYLRRIGHLRGRGPRPGPPVRPARAGARAADSARLLRLLPLRERVRNRSQSVTHLDVGD